MIRFEIVRSADGWRGRFVAANGETCWWTENYRRRAGAVKAIGLLAGPLLTDEDGARVEIRGFRIEVRDVDERETGDAA